MYTYKQPDGSYTFSERSPEQHLSSQLERFNREYYNGVEEEVTIKKTLSKREELINALNYKPK